MDAKQFGAFLLQCRREKGWTQAQLAQMLHVTDKAVSRWERGVGFPDVNTLEPLAEALDISLAELMRGQRLPARSVTLSEASGAVTDALEAAERQHRQENKRLWMLLAAVAVAVLALLFAESWDWDAERILFTLCGVGFPLFCAVGAPALIVTGVARRERLLWWTGIALLVLLVLYFGGFFVLGIWWALAA